MRPPHLMPRPVYEVPTVQVDSDYVTLEDIAEMTRTTMGTTRNLNSQSGTRRLMGETTLTNLPPPARAVGKRLLWRRADIEEWHASRPGKGAPWSGRPRGSRDRVKRKTRSDKGIPRFPPGWEA